MPCVEKANKKGKLLQSHGQYFLAFSHRYCSQHQCSYTPSFCFHRMGFTLLRSSSQMPTS